MIKYLDFGHDTVTKHTEDRYTNDSCMEYEASRVKIQHEWDRNANKSLQTNDGDFSQADNEVVVEKKDNKKLIMGAAGLIAAYLMMKGE